MADSGKTAELKGRAKEATGALRGDEDQRDEGRRDQAKGKARQAGEKISDALDDASDAARRR
jgi:uncharacterized protein YjbJ (UPF0337 family)